MSRLKVLKNINRSMLTIAGGVLLGALLILSVRFFTYRPEHIHYHANFAVYINGQHEQFDDPTLYEESGAACSEERQMTPQERAHMHDNVNDVAHVEDHAVTWGQFFTNLGWIVDAKLIQTSDQLFLADTERKVTFVLNGEPTDNVSNRLIGDQDKLLVDYGSNSELINSRYSDITNKAAKYNAAKDPASCGGSATPSFNDRLKHLF